MFYFLCNTNDWAISNIADIANIIIAAATLFLAFYIFIYQRQKDKKDKVEQERKEQSNKIEALQFQEQNIKLQWFKELIIQPHLLEINNYYKSLHSLEQRITSVTLSEEEKLILSDFIKVAQSHLRRTFVDVLRGVNIKMYNDVIENLDNLTGEITNIIFNDGFDLSHKPTYEKEIGSKITYSRNDLISKIYNYKGV